MSAFVVADKTINLIVAGLGHRYDVLQPEPGGALAFASGSEVERAALGQLMYDVNCDSVRARYGDADESGMIPGSYEYKSVAPPSLVQLFKSIRCWIYQSCESESCGATPVFHELEEYSSAVARHIVNNLPEYDNAPWG